jgi:hypothetical protein
MDFIVRIRELERDRVNFVLKGTNLGYSAGFERVSRTYWYNIQLCQRITAHNDGGLTDSWWVCMRDR